MFKKSVILHAILFAVVLVIYQFSSGWDVIALIVWMIALIVYLTNLSAGQPEHVPLDEQAHQIFPVRIKVNGMFLSVLLEIKVVGPNAKGTLACFNTEEYWRSVIHPAMVGLDTKDPLRTEQAIRGVVQEKAIQFNRRMKELGSSSLLTARVINVAPFSRSVLVVILDHLARDEPEPPA